MVLRSLVRFGHSGATVGELASSCGRGETAVRRAVAALVAAGDALRPDGPRGRVVAVNLPPLPVAVGPAPADVARGQRVLMAERRAVLDHRLREAVAELDGRRIPAGAKAAGAGCRAALVALIADNGAGADLEAVAADAGAALSRYAAAAQQATAQAALDEAADEGRVRELARVRRELAELADEVAELRALARSGGFDPSRPRDLLDLTVRGKRVATAAEEIPEDTGPDLAGMTRTQRALMRNAMGGSVWGTKREWILRSSFAPETSATASRVKASGSAAAGIVAAALVVAERYAENLREEAARLSRKGSHRTAVGVGPVLALEAAPVPGPVAASSSAGTVWSPPAVTSQRTCVLCNSAAVTHVAEMSDGVSVHLCRPDRNNRPVGHGHVVSVVELPPIGSAGYR